MPASPAAVHRLSIVVDRVRANLSHAWTVPEMAAVIGVSSSHLRRLFIENFGATPRQRLCNLRLETAARLLADPSMRIKEIQARVGIADASHFCRDFRERFGASPSEYREALLSCLRANSDVRADTALQMDTVDSDARRGLEKNDSAY